MNTTSDAWLVERCISGAEKMSILIVNWLTVFPRRIGAVLDKHGWMAFG